MLKVMLKVKIKEKVMVMVLDTKVWFLEKLVKMGQAGASE